jgi:hypothetical protein
MTIPQVLEVAIGLILVYYILGSIVSLITQWINESLETRGVALKRYLIKIAGDQKVEDLLSLPQMQSLRPIRYKSLLSVFKSKTEPKMLEKVPVATLVDAYFDMVGLTAEKDNKELSLVQLAELIDKLPDSDGKKAFIAWINQGVTNIADLRKRTNDYFCGLMDQAADTFKANARSFVIILSIAVTLLFGTDSIQLAQALWDNAELRAIAAAKADLVVAEEGSSASLDDLVKELGDLSIQIGWWQTERPPLGATPTDWTWFILLKVAGLVLTAIAVSQGSSFWYDLLKKLSSPTTATSKSTSSGGTSSSTSTVSVG